MASLPARPITPDELTRLQAKLPFLQFGAETGSVEVLDAGKYSGLPGCKCDQFVVGSIQVEPLAGKPMPLVAEHLATFGLGPRKADELFGHRKAKVGAPLVAVFAVAGRAAHFALTHANHQGLPPRQWTSKLGSDLLIRHTLTDLRSVVYGRHGGIFVGDLTACGEPEWA